MDTKAMETLDSESIWLASQIATRLAKASRIEQPRLANRYVLETQKMHEDENGTRPGLFVRTRVRLRAYVPDLAELYQAIRDVLLGISLGVATALLTYFTVSQGFVGLLPGGWGRLLPERKIHPPDFLNLGLTVGGIAVSLLGAVVLGWVLIRLVLSWWKGESRGILWMWWFTTALWLYQSKGVFRTQLIWPTLPLLFTVAVVMAQIAKRKEK
jgi:hypothetical protein